MALWRKCTIKIYFVCPPTVSFFLYSRPTIIDNYDRVISSKHCTVSYCTVLREDFRVKRTRQLSIISDDIILQKKSLLTKGSIDSWMLDCWILFYYIRWLWMLMACKSVEFGSNSTNPLKSKLYLMLCDISLNTHWEIRFWVVFRILQSSYSQSWFVQRTRKMARIWTRKLGIAKEMTCGESDTCSEKWRTCF